MSSRSWSMSNDHADISVRDGEASGKKAPHMRAEADLLNREAETWGRGAEGDAAPGGLVVITEYREASGKVLAAVREPFVEPGLVC